jgi:hypothetical protein
MRRLSTTIEARREIFVRATPRSRGVVLRANVMGPDQTIWAFRITARDRYSDRCWGVGRTAGRTGSAERACRVALARRVQYQPGDPIRVRMVLEGSRSSGSESRAPARTDPALPDDDPPAQRLLVAPTAGALPASSTRTMVRDAADAC